MTSLETQPCPCQSGRPFDRCCGPVLTGERHVATASQLMRSRYVAYVLGDAAHLRASWHPTTRPARVAIDESIAWTGLEVQSSTGGDLFDDQGTVSFVATYNHNGVAGELCEHSLFTRVERQWYYVGPVAIS